MNEEKAKRAKGDDLADPCLILPSESSNSSMLYRKQRWGNMLVDNSSVQEPHPDPITRNLEGLSPELILFTN